jgi:N-acetylglucosamine transport system permease protein
MYQTAFRNSEFGYATAIGVALLLMTLSLTAVMFRVTQRERIEF